MTTTLIRARIVHDDSPESPRTWGRAGHLITWDRNGINIEDENGRQRWLRDVNGIGGRRMAHEHMRGESCVARASLPNGQHFREGFIYMTAAEALEEFGSLPRAERTRAALEFCKGEAELYVQWADGDVYGYIIERRTLCTLCEALDVEDVPAECPHCEIDDVDSCWGFYGLDARQWGADLEPQALEALYAESDAYHVEYGHGRIEAEWRIAA